MTDVVSVTFSGGPSADWYSSLKMDRTLLGTPQDSVDTVKAVWDALKGIMVLGTTIHVSGVVEVHDPITGQPTGIESVTGYNISCTANFEPLPYQTQGLITWNTGTWVGGRQIRGRMYVPAITEFGNESPGIPTAAVLTALGNAAAAFITPVDNVPVVYSKVHQATYPVTAANVGTKWALMKTRR